MQVERIDQSDFGGTVFERLQELDDCPHSLSYRGSMPSNHKRLITVVGSRTPTPYAREAIEHIIRGLGGQSVCIVSGLALGIDALAHQAAIRHKITAIAFPGSGLGEHVLYPASNRVLAQEILHQDGLLVSELSIEQQAAPWTFPKRNRLMARIADMVLVVEAREQSGTLITARNASEYSVEVGVIPGSIFNEGCRGSNHLLQEGAQVITSAEDILSVLGLSTLRTDNQSRDDISSEEQKILEYLVEPLSRDQLIQRSGLSAQELTSWLTLLELKGYVQEKLGAIYRI